MALLWWALHDVSLTELAARARGTRPLPFIMAIVLATLAFPVRTVRWRYLLQVDGKKLAFTPLWHATAIGFMANNLLPARAGEVARIYAAGRLTKASYSSSLASVAIERVFDGLVIIALMALAISAGGFREGGTIAGIPPANLALGAATAFVLILLVAMAAVRWTAQAIALSRKFFGKILSRQHAARAVNIIEGMLSGLDSLKSPSRFTAVLFWSLVVWLVNGSAFWFAFVALDVDVQWTGAFLLQGVIALGIAVPSSPGYFGPFEALTRATLALYGVSAAQSVSYAVVFHVGGFVPITLLGLYSLSRAHLHLSDLTTASESNLPEAN